MADPAWFPDAKLNTAVMLHNRGSRRGEWYWLKEQTKTFVQADTSFCSAHIHAFRTSTILNHWKMKLAFLVCGKEESPLLLQ